MKKFYLAVIGMIATLLLVSCDGPKDGNGKLNVVTTATMVTDLVKVIGGDDVEVVGLMAPEVDPHSYEPVLTDMKKLNRADAIFFIGLHLEGKMQDDLEGRGKKGQKVFALTDGIEGKDLLAPQDDYPGHNDPHVWGDVMLWAQCAIYVGEKLAEVDPDNAESYRKRAADYVKELEELHAWAKKRVAEVPQHGRVLITSHDAFFYFGRAYEFDVKGLQGLSTDSEVGAGGRAALIKLIRERGVKAVFGESSVNEKGIAGVAREAGVTLSEEKLYSDAMGSTGDRVERGGESYDRGTYVGMIKHNVNTVVDALR